MTGAAGARAAASACVVAAVVALAGCTAGSAPPPGTSSAGARPARPPYIAMTDAVVAHGGTAWIETDLVKAWLAGPTRYQQVLDTVAFLASRPGVGGVKIADELGYHDGMDLTRAQQFLTQATGDLHRRVPGREVMVDMVVPELGCLAWRSAGVTERMRACAERAKNANPAASIAAVDSYLAQGGLDVLDLSAGLRPDAEYASWGVARDAAMTSIWQEAQRRWGGEVVLQARKALAHPGSYQGSAAQAEADVHTYVDIPVAHGARAVDIWTWSQPYRGETYRLTDPGLSGNALMTALSERAAEGVQLWTHMTPSSLQRDTESDVTAALATFSTILVAAGTG